MTLLAKEIVLKHALVAFEKQKQTADAFASHRRNCKICRNKIRSFFSQCAVGLNMEFEHRIAQAEADLSRDTLRLMATPKSVAAPEALYPNPSVKWLEGLYKLKDERSE